MEIIRIKNKLKRCQPYFIEKELMPKLYLKKDKSDLMLDDFGHQREIEYWIFKYIFIFHASEKNIAIRLNYSQQSVSIKLRKILERNKYLINNFLVKYW